MTLLSDADKEPSPDQPEKESVPTFDESGDNLTIDYHGPYLGTKEEFLNECGVDQAIWAIDRIVCNGWEVTGKKRQDGEERVWKSRNKQIKVFLKRRAPKGIQDGIAELLRNWNPQPLPPPNYRASTGEKCMALFLPADSHYGKRCWAALSGGDFDLDIASDIFRRIVDQACERIAPFNPERIDMSDMGDFFQTNGFASTTVRGTVVDSVDDRFPKVFNRGFEDQCYAIERFRQIAPVKKEHVPGNHDGQSNWFLSRVIAERYRNDPHVTIDTEPRSRKYGGYGVTAWMLTHGNCRKKDLPLTFAKEAPKLWAEARFRMVLTGHEHTKKTETFAGCEVHSLPSTSGTDAWHHDGLYVGNEQEAETFVISRAHGPIGRFSLYAQPEATSTAQG